ncbi:MAG: response regulator [Deltaproteobacteria bacterium]|nr:response regulator [Deltaproteobacteria bacterium]MBI3390529.1 response regulator [Deltaproteobacteria bacterium]
MSCLSCGQDNPSDAAFCGECGNDLTAVPVCGGCGRSNVRGARFCHGCGAAVTAPAPRPAAEETESETAALVRRVAALETDLTDVAAEVAGLNSLKEQLQDALDGLRRRAGAAKPAQPAPSAEPGVPSRAEPPPPPRLVAVSPDPAPHVVAAPNTNGERLTILHVEDQPPLQDVVRAVVEKFNYARYSVVREPLNGTSGGRRLLAINLLAQSADPLATLANSTAWGIENPWALAYCADGARGLILGMVDFFPPPFEPNLCVTRLLERPSASQRLLVVSDALDLTTELRSILTRLGCATSVAFDGKQALGLVPMVRPDVILVDLNLPKGDAFRVISRVRADPANVAVTFALMWQSTLNLVEFRQQVMRAAREFPFSGDDLRRAVGREFGPGGAAYFNPNAKAA